VFVANISPNIVTAARVIRLFMFLPLTTASDRPYSRAK
jgi:hypothetical protein